MQFARISEPWQLAFELAWDAFRQGSNPIAAVVVDGSGKVVATGKSAVGTSMSDVVLHHNELAHAEVNALLALDNREHPKEKASTYTLYATLEPCPVCFAAFYMSDVLRLHYAARDRFGGSTNLAGTTPYLSRKRRHVEGPVPLLEDVSIFLNVYHNLRQGEELDIPIHQEMALDYPAAVALAGRIYQVGQLTDHGDFAPVFEQIIGWLSDG